MAGPVAQIVVPRKLTVADHATVYRLIDAVPEDEGDGRVRLHDRPFAVDFGEEWPGELAEIQANGLADVIGWQPEDLIALVAFCNSDEDHRLLAESCIVLCTAFAGVIDFTGPFSFGPILPEDRFTPCVKAELPEGLTGSLYACTYEIDGGGYGTTHFGDVELLQSWSRMPNFRMVK